MVAGEGNHTCDYNYTCHLHNLDHFYILSPDYIHNHICDYSYTCHLHNLDLFYNDSPVDIPEI